MLADFGPLLMKDVSFCEQDNQMSFNGLGRHHHFEGKKHYFKGDSKTHRLLCKYAFQIMSCEAMDNKLLVDKYIN